jgi:hypothetical protein
VVKGLVVLLECVNNELSSMGRVYGFCTGLSDEVPCSGVREESAAIRSCVGRILPQHYFGEVPNGYDMAWFP